MLNCIDTTCYQYSVLTTRTSKRPITKWPKQYILSIF